MNHTDPELEIIGLIEIAFHDLDEKARLRILVWAIDWHQQHAEHKNTSALQLLEPSMKRLDEETRRRVFNASMILFGSVKEQTPTRPTVDRVVRRWSPLRRLIKPKHCSLCHRTGHDRRQCDRYPATSRVLSKVG